MPKIIFLPHQTICPNGAEIDADVGSTLCATALLNGVEIEHSCEQACACTTCHVHIREGGEHIAEASELEEDMMDRAWGLDADSRLSCQVIIVDNDMVVEIPKYTINMVSERQ
jgi:2Fe-2S ferredoxin